ncbi:MAG: hypothetical protein KAT62_15165 [Desulfuromonadales bacterium]|nr:hypothetical protein [Chloroflexota bacterium]MCK4623538.1 hypothetical protein [Desulfuromonadales bacterium]
MQRWLCLAILVLLFSGCSWGKYSISKQEYQSRVQVLGVLPVLIDRAGALEHPQKEALYDLLTRSVLGKHEILVERLRKKKGYFDVRVLPGSTDLIALSLLSGEESRDEDGRPRGYLFNPESVAELTQRNVVDALLVVVFSGAQVEETRRSRTLLETLKTRYNDILATAVVIDRDGQVLWRLTDLDSYRVLMLQYPDFDEAYYNQTDLVQVKNISWFGIEKALEARPSDREQIGLPETYDKLFDRIVSGISPSLFD